QSPIDLHWCTLFHLPPLLNPNNEVEAFFPSNTSNAEDLCHINDTNPAHFHVIARHFGCRGHELLSLKHRNARYVVSHKTVAALNQPQYTFAFPDTTYAADQHTDTQYIHYTS